MTVTQVVRSIFRISGSGKQFVRPIALSALSTLLFGLTYMIVAWFFGGRLELTNTLLFQCFIVLTVLAICYLLVVTIARLQSTLMACAMVAKARVRLGEHLQRLPLSFFKRKDPGTVTAYILQDMVSVENVFSQFFVELVASVMLPLIFASLFFSLDWRLAMPLCLVFVLAFPVLHLARAAVREYGQKHIESRNKVFLYVIEYISGVRELRSCMATGMGFKPLAQALERQRSSLMRFELSSVGPILVYSALLDLGFVVMFFVGIWLLSVSMIDAGTLVIFLVLGGKFFEPLRDIGAFLAELKGMGTAAVRITGVLDQRPLPVNETEVTPAGNAIEFRNVSFAYEEKKHALDNVSFTVAEGSVTALAGPSGGGKTTIASLVARFWDVQSGSISIGGLDIRSLQPETLLGKLSVVFQDIYIFHDTVFNNIRIGNPEATDHEVMEAAKAACCHDFIMKLPQGYQTVVGGVSSGLSGGERQRLSIARAILKDAPIVLLDEATSALDPENELALQSALNNLLYGKTVLVIAHRLATICDADQILILDQGCIVEQGTHEQLMDKKGLYHRHWDLQHQTESWQFRASFMPLRQESPEPSSL
ncbi:ABC transporter ATP-binding protein [Oleidesulfovibrio sp.]|uniref:ABC transporter ATP-binding protein n=1 Tax=Oleidesulfovibrio sp. TaxID=2909707 RepID=UPI003A86EB88